MDKFIKWLFQYKKRHYIIRFIATGIMGNEYDVGTYEVKVSDNELKELKKIGVCLGGRCFSENRESLQRHFKVVGGRFVFVYHVTSNNS